MITSISKSRYFKIAYGLSIKYGKANKYEKGITCCFVGTNCNYVSFDDKS